MSTQPEPETSKVLDTIDEEKDLGVWFDTEFFCLIEVWQNGNIKASVQLRVISYRQ